MRKVQRAPEEGEALRDPEQEPSTLSSAPVKGEGVCVRSEKLHMEQRDEGD